MQSGWRPIKPTGLSTNVPQLFVKYEFFESGYAIYLTDLYRIFVEKINEPDLLQRSTTEQTSIDPTEDASQLSILLEKIRGALAGANGTALHLLKGGKADQLVLHTIALLPKPLGTLRWPIHLTLAGPEEIANELTLPAIRSSQNLSKQVSDLISHLRDKDHVILKLIDRLEQSGTDLSTVFPGAGGVKSSKRVTTREQAARHVKGLGQFDLDRWRTEFLSTPIRVDTIGNIVCEVFEHTENQNPDKQDLTPHETWWKTLKTQSQAQHATEELAEHLSRLQNSGQKINGHNPVPPSVDLDDGETTEDEDMQFDTAGHQSQTSVYSRDRDAEETASEEEQTPPKLVEMKKKPGPAKLGRIGGAQKAVAIEEHSKSVDSTSSTMASASSPLLEALVVQPKKPKLGRIGGNKSTATKDGEKDLRSAKESSFPQEAESKSKYSGQQALEVRSSPRGESSRVVTPEREDHEIEDESPKRKADRRRAELKRELEAKAQAPTKKKRRF